MPTSYITIIGRNIRDNIHRDAGTVLAPVLGLYCDGVMSYGLGAIIHGDARTIYAARPAAREVCGAEVYIKTEARIELFSDCVRPPAARSHFIHTNTHHSKANRALVARSDAAATLAFKPVVSVRGGKSAKARMCMEVIASGTSHVIYAAPHGIIAPMPCGARVWQQVCGSVTLCGANDQCATTERDMDDMEEIGQMLQSTLLCADNKEVLV